MRDNRQYKKSQFEIQRLPTLGENELWRARAAAWREPEYSDQQIREVRAYSAALGAEATRRATPADGTLEPPMIEVEVVSTTAIKVLHSVIPTNWKLAYRAGAGGWKESSGTEFEVTGLTAGENTVRARFVNGGSLASPTNSTATVRVTVDTSA